MARKSKQAEDALSSTTRPSIIDPTDYLSTGSTMLDLACSNSIHGGLIKGKYFFFVGDSASGKTWLSLSCLAEAAMNPHFNDYRFIYDNVEDGALMDIGWFFGPSVADRLELPGEYPSQTIEEFYFHVDDACEQDVPFIYILDSMDALSSTDEQEKFDETKKAYRKGRETAGSYGDGKAKKNAANLRRVLPKLRDTGSILLIINQTRDNLGFGFEKKTRSGGHALKFYAALELWTSIKGKKDRTVKGKKRRIGIDAQVQIKKNRITGKDRKVVVPIYDSYGIDNTGSMVDFLVEEKRWSSNGQTINAHDISEKASREKLIRVIEEEDLTDLVKETVQEVWQEIEDACALDRKPRYE